MGYVIFDLDGTVIDTSHRYRNKPCGTIDLDYWFANSTPEMVAKDALLPLAESMRRIHAAGHTVVICTARDFTRNDLMPEGFEPDKVYRQFLADNDLPYHALLYRNLAGPDHATLSDGDLKIRLLENYAFSQGFDSIREMGAIMFDDNLHVIETMNRIGILCFNAVYENERLAA